MRTTAFIIFVSIALLVYSLPNLYVFIRGWQAIPKASGWRAFYGVCFPALALAYIAGRLWEHWQLSPGSELLMRVGSFWLALLVYLFLGVLLLDLLRLAHSLFQVWPPPVVAHYARARLIALLVVAGGALLTVAAGHWNACRPRLKDLDIRVAKPVRGPAVLTIAAVSDIHLGTLIRNDRVERLVARVNELNPDLILLPGDIVDEDLAPVIARDTGSILRNLKAPLGVFAVMGNHEYIGGGDPAARYLEAHGIRMLRDAWVQLPNGVIVVGREDRSVSRFTGRERKTLGEIMRGVDTRHPVILMDHQPFQLAEAASAGVDVQLSGHTHHGQLWPFNYITRGLYQISWGYGRIRETQYYISSGFGTWGPPVRVGNRPEIVRIRLTFQPAHPVEPV